MGALDYTYGVKWQFPNSSLQDPLLRSLVIANQNGRMTSPGGFAGIRAFENYDSQLIIQASVKVPMSLPFLSSSVTSQERTDQSSLSGPTAQVYLYLVFLDEVKGDLFFCLFGLYDTTGHHGEIIRPDDGSGRPLASIYLPVDGTSGSSSLVNLSPYSRGFSASTWSDDRFFRVHLNRANMIRLINAINTQRAPGNKLTGDPSNYLLIDAALQAELKWAKHAGAAANDANARDNITLGYSFSGFSVWKLR